MLHAKLAPSSASRRFSCPGSRALESQYPENEQSDASREGTAAHWVASEYLSGRYSVGRIAPNGEPITKEMLDGADLYEHTIRWVSDDLHIEERVDISNIHPECWGTPDCWTVVDGHLHVFDYKFGHGFVDVFENYQLLEYAAGIAQCVMFSEVTLTIIQPRCYSASGQVRSWKLTAPDLYGYIAKLKISEAKAMQPEAECVPSPQCMHCTARHACTSLQNTAGRIVDLSKQSTAFDLTPMQTGLELTHLKRSIELLQARATGLEEQAKSMISRGELVTGFRLESSHGREHWNCTADEVIMLGEMMDLNLAKPREAITPVQARKLGLDEQMVNAYSQRVPGKLKLVEEKDRAARVFKK